MENRIVSVLGSVAKHILHSLRRAFIAISIAGLSVAVVAGAATEGIAAFLTKSFPSGPTHLAAAAMAIAFGYAAAMTVAIVEILKGLVEAIELVVKETEKLAAEAVHEAERLGGEALRDAGRAGRAALGGAETVGRDALGGAETIGRDAVGVVGGVVGGVEHGVGSVFHHGQGTGSQPPNAPRS
jgi:hypothetical protein